MTDLGFVFIQGRDLQVNDVILAELRHPPLIGAERLVPEELSLAEPGWSAEIIALIRLDTDSPHVADAFKKARMAWIVRETMPVGQLHPIYDNKWYAIEEDA